MEYDEWSSSFEVIGASRAEPTTIPTVLPRWKCQRKRQTTSDGKTAKRRKRESNGASVPSVSGNREVMNSGGMEVVYGQGSELGGRGGGGGNGDIPSDEAVSDSAEVRNVIDNERAGVPGDDIVTIAVNEEEMLGGANGLSKGGDDGKGLASEDQVSAKVDLSVRYAKISRTERCSASIEEDKINEEPTYADSLPLDGAANKSIGGEVTSPDPAGASFVNESAGGGTESHQSPGNRDPASEVQDSRMDDGSDSTNSSSNRGDETSSYSDSSSSSSDEDDGSEPEDEAPTKLNPVETKRGGTSDIAGRRKLSTSDVKFGRASNYASDDPVSVKQPRNRRSNDGPVDVLPGECAARRLRVATILFAHR